MKFADDKELEQFIEIACMLKYYKAKGVPIPAEVQDMIERNRNESEACNILFDMIEH